MHNAKTKSGQNPSNLAILHNQIAMPRWTHAPSNTLTDDPQRRRRVLVDGREVGSVEQIGARWHWRYYAPGEVKSEGSAPDMTTALECVRGAWQGIRDGRRERREAWERQNASRDPADGPPRVRTSYRKKRSRTWHLKYLEGDGNGDK